MSETDSTYRGTKEYLLVYCELIRAARYSGTTTYQALAQIMDLPLSGSWMGTATGNMLREISRNEHQHGRPMLSAVVVGVSGVPGQGFYGLAEERGRFKGGSKEDKLRFWEEERKVVYDE
jgi:hypothetical protein